MKKRNTSSRQDSAAGKRHSWMPVVVLLLVLALITSSILGYVLGRNTGTPPLGQIIDTIVLEPEESDVQTALHLAGKVVYSDGTPASGRTLELHSDPATAVSDSNGGFLFENVPQGEHTVSIFNADGTTAAECKINILRNADTKNVSIQQQGKSEYTMEIAVDIRVLEIQFQLDSQMLTIRPEFTYATKDGIVTTPTGSASIKNGVIVTPQGNIFLPDGSVVFPGGNKTDPTRVLLPDDSVAMNKPLSIGDIKVSADGVVTLPDGTVIEPGGQIKKPTGKDETPGDTGVVFDDGITTPIEGEVPVKPTDPAPSSRPEGTGSSSTPNTSSPVSRPESSSTPSSNPAKPPSVSSEPSTSSEAPSESESPSSSEAPGESEPPSSSEGPGGAEPPPASSQPPSSSETPSEPEIPDDGTLNAYGQNKDGTYMEWTQNRTIDLFYNRTSGDRDKIAPGSSGYYLFRLENNRRSDLRIQVNLSESNVHLPLSFTLTPLDAKGNKLSGKAVSGSLDGNGITLNATVGAGDAVTYRLDWVWPSKGNNEKDTIAGSGANRIYTLFMKIHAEEGALYP